MALQPIQFIEERLIATSLLVGRGHLFDDGHQRFGNEPAAVHAEMAARVGIMGGRFGHCGAGARQFRFQVSGHLARRFRA